MPYYDGTGPTGIGHIRLGLGPCGLGLRRGAKLCGYGFRHRIWTTQDEKAVLEDEQKMLKEELKAVQDELKALKSQE